MEKQMKDLSLYIIILIIFAVIMFGVVAKDILNEIKDLNHNIKYLTKKVIQLEKPRIVETDTIITIKTIDTVYQIKEYK